MTSEGMSRNRSRRLGNSIEHAEHARVASLFGPGPRGCPGLGARLDRVRAVLEQQLHHFDATPTASAAARGSDTSADHPAPNRYGRAPSRRFPARHHLDRPIEHGVVDAAALVVFGQVCVCQLGTGLEHGTDALRIAGADRFDEPPNVDAVDVGRHDELFSSPPALCRPRNGKLITFQNPTPTALKPRPMLLSWRAHTSLFDAMLG